MVTIFVILAITAFVVTIVSAMGKCPLYVAVLVLCLMELLRTLPLGR